MTVLVGGAGLRASQLALLPHPEPFSLWSFHVPPVNVWAFLVSPHSTADAATLNWL